MILHPTGELEFTTDEAERMLRPFIAAIEHGRQALHNDHVLPICIRIPLQGATLFGLPIITETRLKGEVNCS